MNGNRTTKSLSTILAVMLVLCLALSFFACDDGENNGGGVVVLPTLDAAKITETTTNGSFYTTTGETFPKTPSSWTGATGSTASSTATPAGTDDVMSGVVCLQSDYYDANKSSWGNLANPGLQTGVPAANDYNVLMIYNKYNDATAGTAYSYSNSSTSLLAGNFYKLTFSVLTTGLQSNELSGEANKGAYITVSNNVVHTFGPINTNGNWQTYTIYVESNPSAAKSVTIALSLGKGDSTTGTMTKGFAFFDSIDAKLVDEAEYLAATAGETSAKYSLAFTNPNFTQYTGSASVGSSIAAYTPTGYTTMAGSAVVESTGSSTQTTSSYVSRGIVNVTDAAYLNAIKDVARCTKVVFSESELAALAAAPGGDAFALMILNKEYPSSNSSSDYTEGNAAGYKTTNTFRVPMGKVVKLSVSVWTKIVNADADANVYETDAEGNPVLDDENNPILKAAQNGNRGATIKLTGAETLSTTVKPSDANTDWVTVNTHGAWETYSFYVRGSNYADADFTLEMWLGQGNTAEQYYYAAGVAFFDNIEFEIMDDATEYDAVSTAIAAGDTATLAAHNVKAGATMLTALPQEANVIANGSFSDATDPTVGWAVAPVSDVHAVENTDYAYRVITGAQAVDAEYIKTTFGIEDATAKTVGVPHDNVSQIFALQLMNDSAINVDLEQSLTIKKNVYYRISLWIKTIGIPTGSGLSVNLLKAEDDSSSAAFTAINTAAYTNYITSDYIQYSFYYEGAYLTDTDLKLNIQFGKGTNVSTAAYLSGTAFIANVSMNVIKASDYTSATSGNYVKKTSLTSSASSTITNGLFDIFDKTTTDYNPETGELETVPGIPTTWTKTGATEDFDKATTGIVNTNDSTLMTNLGLTKEGIFNRWFETDADGDLVTDGSIIGDGAPSLLMLRADQTGIAPIAYTYSSLSLSSGSYYIIFVDVKTFGGAKASVYLSASTIADSNLSFTNIDTTEGGADTWSRMMFFVEVGLASTSVKLDLYLGGEKAVPTGVDEDTYISAGEGVFFDNVRYLTYTDESAFDKACEKYSANNYATGTTLNTQEQVALSTSFITDSFDTDSGVTSSTSPFPAVNSSNFSGTATGTKTGKSNIVMGILSKDVEVEDLESTGILYDVEGVDADNNPITTTETRYSLTPTELTTLFNTTRTTLGDNVLMINNLADTGYNYKSKTSRSFLKDTYYEISVWVLTYRIPEGKGAFVRLSSGSDGDTHTFSGINTSYNAAGEYTADAFGSWTKYSYYIYNETEASISSVYLTLGLGEAGDENIVAGYAFFDNVTVRKISAEDYNVYADAIPAPTANADGTYNKRQGNIRADMADAASETIGKAWVLNYASNEGANDADEPEEEEPAEEPVAPEQESAFPWDYVAMAVISVAILAAVIAVLVRKFAPKRKGAVSADKKYDRNYTGGDNTAAERRRNEYEQYADRKPDAKKKSGNNNRKR